jgi:hypothetical protein
MRWVGVARSIVNSFCSLITSCETLGLANMEQIKNAIGDDVSIMQPKIILLHVHNQNPVEVYLVGSQVGSLTGTPGRIAG